MHNNVNRKDDHMNLIRVLVLFLMIGFSGIHAQGVDSTWLGTQVRIETGQNITHTGTLLGFDDKEYLIETAVQGNVTIPKYMVLNIERIPEDELELLSGNNLRPARNFITATAFPVQRGNIECSMFYIAAGTMDAGLTDRLSLSVSTAWLIASTIGIKYTLLQGAGISLAVSGTVGSMPFSGFSGEYSGVAGRGILTFGKPDHCLSVSGGYLTNFGKDEWIDYGWPGGGFWQENHFDATFAGLSGYSQLSPRIGLLGEVNMGFNEDGYLGFGVVGARVNSRRKIVAIDFGIGSPIIQESYDTFFLLPYIGAMFRL